MRLALVVVVALAGCQPEPKDFDRLPGGGGGIGGGGGGGNNDAALDDGDVGSINGRVCVLSDLRLLTLCAEASVGGLTVTLGDSTTTTLDDGSFVITTPTGTDLVWRVTGDNLVTTVVEFGTSFELPAIRQLAYLDLQNSNGVLLTAGQGSVVVAVTSTSEPVPDVIVDSNPLAQFATRYDGTSSTVWNETATGNLGVAWLPGLTAGTVTLTATHPTIDPVSDAVPVEADSITFAKIAL